VDQERAPKEGEIFVNKNMAETLKRIAKDAKKGYYEGQTADAIVEAIQAKGGVMTHQDLKDVEVVFCDPIHVDVDSDIRLHELPPNNQGLVAIIAIGIINELDRQGKISLKSMKHNSVEYLHLLIETLKFAFKDGEEYITDIGKLDYNPQDFTNPEYLRERAKLFSPNKANDKFDHGVLNPSRKSDTSYFTVTDSEGNACSFIASLYTAFGSGIVPKGTGFALHNRGSNFNLTPGTRNCFEGGKRPYHTIIPAMITNTADSSLFCTYGVMGGFMQPQGHAQVAFNLKLFGMNPQDALDAPRICLYPDPDGVDSGLGSDSPVSTPQTIVGIEEGISSEVIEGLRKLGHNVKLVVGAERGLFGRGQVIKCERNTSGSILWSAGSDLRGDGHAQPQLY
jgi:gamma-glutamyltranspeptidase/glutathione hydrolase